MTLSFVLLAIGVLCAFYEAVFGVTRWQGRMDTYSERIAYALKARPVAVIGTGLVVVSIGLDVA